MIRLEKVTKSFAGKPVLAGVDLEVNDGETLVIVGPSGTGKSVTLKHMVRLLMPDEGQVWVDDKPLGRATGRELETIRGAFGMLFQGGALLQWLTVGENVALPLREKSAMSETEIVETAREKLALVGLADDYDKWPAELSGGMRKRAGLARAIVENPRYVLYDEPTSGLDPVSSRMIDALIMRLRKDLGVTSVVVTHDLHSALVIGDRIAMLDSGTVADVAPPAAFIESKHPAVKEFLAAQYITRRGDWESGSG